MASKLKLQATPGTAAASAGVLQTPSFLSGLALPRSSQRDAPLGARGLLPRRPRVSASASSFSKQAQVRPLAEGGRALSGSGVPPCGMDQTWRRSPGWSRGLGQGPHDFLRALRAFLHEGAFL